MDSGIVSESAASGHRSNDESDAAAQALRAAVAASATAAWDNALTNSGDGWTGKHDGSRPHHVRNDVVEQSLYHDPADDGERYVGQRLEAGKVHGENHG
jgi:hypothetical protein